MSNVQVFFQVQVGQEGRCPLAILGGQVGLTDLVDLVVLLDLRALSGLDPLISLSSKNTTLMLETYSYLKVVWSNTDDFFFDLTYLSFIPHWPR